MSNDLLERMSVANKDKAGYREYIIAYYIRGFMSNESLVGKHCFWDSTHKPIDMVANFGFILSMGPYKHLFKQIDGVWKFIYKDETNYE